MAVRVSSVTPSKPKTPWHPGSAGPPPVGMVVAGKYEIEALIGQGGMGAVYRAQHVLTHRRVALKWLLADDEAMRMRFVREARAMGALEHPNVVGILDIGEESGAVYLVMEYVEGESLREHLNRKPVSAARAVSLLMPALEGIAAAHQAGIVHRDLKPANLFVCLDRDGTAYGTKVLDFGVALSLRQSGSSLGLTQSGAVVGTPRYMAPEQIRSAKIDARADQFAMGLILYEMLTGRLPYDAEVYEALVVEIATVTPPSPRVFVEGLPEGLSEVVLKALAKSPDDRFEDIAAFAQALEPFGEGVVFSPPRQAHARRSMLGEDIMELAVASAGLTPSRPGPAPSEVGEPATRRLGPADSAPTNAAAKLAAVRASATTLDAPDREHEQATRQARARVTPEDSGERTRSKSAEVVVGDLPQNRGPWLAMAALVLASLVLGAWWWQSSATPAPVTTPTEAVTNEGDATGSPGPAGEPAPSEAATSLPTAPAAAAAATEGTDIDEPATGDDEPVAGAEEDDDDMEDDDVPAAQPDRGRRRPPTTTTSSSTSTMNTATAPSMSAMGRSGAFSVEDF